MLLRALLPLALTLTIASQALAAPMFQGLPLRRVEGISGDGQVAFGYQRLSSPTRNEAATWTAMDGVVTLGQLTGGTGSYANAANADGSIIVGSADDDDYGSSPNLAFHWTQATGFQALDATYPLTSANAISADGSVIAGSRYRWTQASGITPIAGLKSPVMSADGSVLAGNGDGLLGTEAVRWTEALGLELLGTLGGTASYGKAISADGTVIVGTSRRADGAVEGFSWTQADGMVGLGLHGNANTEAYDVSGDGTRIVGLSARSPRGTAVLWDSQSGIRSIQSILEDDYGLDLGGWELEKAVAISDDGLTVVGMGLDPDGVAASWMAGLEAPPPTVPEPSTSALAGAALGLWGWRRRLGR